MDTISHFLSEGKMGWSDAYIKYAISCIEYIGVIDKIHAGVGSRAIYCLCLQAINAMNQKTALFFLS